MLQISLVVKRAFESKHNPSLPLLCLAAGESFRLGTEGLSAASDRQDELSQNREQEASCWCRFRGRIDV